MAAPGHGCLITLEGGEGAGKTTQIQVLDEFLSEQGITVVKTREPGGSEGAEEIRNLLVTGNPQRWDAVTELLLMSAARRDHVERVIRPALARGDWVVCDRFADSSMAYQGCGRELGLETVGRVQKLVLGDLTADLTLYLDIDVQAGLARARSRGDDEDRFEKLELDFHQRIRDGFLEMARREPERFAVIDADRSPPEVQDNIRRVVRERLGLAAGKDG